MKKNESLVYTTMVLTFICAGVALMLAVIHMFTAPKIAAKEASEKEAAIKSLIPGLITYESVDIKEVNETITGISELFVVHTDSEDVLCANVAPKGFSDSINMIVAVTMDMKVIGVKVLSHSETAGVGTRIMNEDFLASFFGINKTTLDSGVDTISGATVSSLAVKKGVATSLEAAESYINKQKTE